MTWTLTPPDDFRSGVAGIRSPRIEVEYLSVDTSGDLGYVVALEGGWKLRHWHMDHLGGAGVISPAPAPRRVGTGTAQYG